jgi:hypothetical protein
MTKQLCSIPKSAFQNCFEDLQKRWKQHVDAQGSHFEGKP